MKIRSEIHCFRHGSDSQPPLSCCVINLVTAERRRRLNDVCKRSSHLYELSLFQELDELRDGSLPQFSFSPIDGLLHWKGTIAGTPESPFFGGCFQLDFYPTYPACPPTILDRLVQKVQVKFLTTIYHPNIDGKGNICFHMGTAWTPQMESATFCLTSITSFEGQILRVRCVAMWPMSSRPIASSSTRQLESGRGTVPAEAFFGAPSLGINIVRKFVI